MSPHADFILPDRALSQERKVQGCSLGSNRFRLDIPFFVELAQSDRLDLEAMVSSRIGLDDLNAAFDDLEKGRLARAIVTFEDNGSPR